MRHASTFAVLMLSVLLASEAWGAGKGSGGSGSLTNAGLIGSGKNAAYGTFGWPGMTAGYLRGLDGMDIGARVSFAYGCEGAPSLPCTGLEIAGDLKLVAPISGLPGPILLRLQPGLGIFGAAFNVTVFSLELPVEVLMSFRGIPQLTWHLGVEIPFAIGFASSLGFSYTTMQIPIWLGGGIEYGFSPDLSVHGQLHMGPYIGTTFNVGTVVIFGFDSVIGVTYRF